MRITNSIEQQRCLMNACIDKIEQMTENRSVELIKHVRELYHIANEVYACYGCDPSCSVLGDRPTFEALMAQAQTLIMVCKIYGNNNACHELKKFTTIAHAGAGSC